MGHGANGSGLRFHVREDALNEQQNMIDIAVLKPLSRLGGVSYARVTQGFELPRPDFGAERKEHKVAEEAAKAAGLE